MAYNRWINGIRMGIALVIVVLAAYVCGKTTAAQQDPMWYAGEGTREQPYIVASAQDLAELAATVNAGNTYAGCYFMQTDDIDLSCYDNWTPIGVYDGEYAFAGVYDGNGHVITNLVVDGTQLSNGNVGLFGKLGGVVCNLGIESGEIKGACVGGITSHSASENAMIVNCYNKASLSGSRCGGIADNFGTGKIIACYNEGTLSGDCVGDISSFGAGVIYGCYGRNGLTGSYFRGSEVAASEVCEKVDQSKIRDRIKEAEYLFDLQNLNL